MNNPVRLSPSTDIKPHAVARRIQTDKGGETGTGATVLVIDDDPTIRLLIASGLQRKHYQIALAADGQQGLEAFARHAPDLVLVDVSMPGLNGFDTLRAIRQGQAGHKGQHVPLLMLTGCDDVDSIKAAFEAGATDFLTKPINLPLLAERVRYALSGAEREKALREAQLEQASACKLARLGFWQLDVTTGTLHWSEGAAEMLGWPSLPTSVTSLLAMVNEADRPRLETALTVASHNREGLDLELSLGQGSLERTLRLQSAEPASEQRLVGAFQDVTTLRAFEDKALDLAAHDELTGLPKRHCFLSLLAEQLRQAGGTRWLVAVLDITRLHRINEALGIRAGDQALVLFSRRLKQHVPSQALLGRLEADTFGVALPLSATEDPRQACQPWLAPLASPAHRCRGRLSRFLRRRQCLPRLYTGCRGPARRGASGTAPVTHPVRQSEALFSQRAPLPLRCRQAQPGSPPAAGAAEGRVLSRLPAAAAPGGRTHQRRGSPAALAACQSRGDLPGGIHPVAGRNRTHRRSRRLGDP